MQEVDAEVRRIIDEQYAVAYKILDENRDKMHTMAKALIEWETIERDQVLEIMAGKQPSPPKEYNDNIIQENATENPTGETEAEATSNESEQKVSAETDKEEKSVEQEKVPEL